MYFLASNTRESGERYRVNKCSKKSNRGGLYTLRILIAEDEQRTRQGLVRVLQSLRDEYEIVAQASNGKAALEMILEQKPDVVLLISRCRLWTGFQ
ncbi:response regulator [Ruminococcus sp. AM50-15BH]|nr:response regulator [Ruminococcus sp. AM50-15BH]RHS62154.1 response regulator [Ruminococcus sp. AM46-18]RHS79845.1 response regulator [Ruminococcus sp. AM44-9AT]RHU75849.1 response regulator [Ruminococcus sp. TF06-23]